MRDSPANPGSLRTYKHLEINLKLIRGAELALGASDLAETELEMARTLLRVRVIPHVIDSVWECGQTAHAGKSRRRPLNTSAVGELSRLAVTFPGSTALTAMHRVLDQQGIDPSVATEYLTEFARLSRDPLAVLNHFRHVKTSINVYLRALIVGWDEEKMKNESRTNTLVEIRSRVTPFVVIDQEKKIYLRDKAFKLTYAELGSNTSIDEWLDQMTNLVSESILEDRKSRPSRSIYESQITNVDRSASPATTHTLNLYSGRFTHYIYKYAIKSLEIKASHRYKVVIENQDKKRIEALDALMAKSTSQTYDYLEAIASQRPERSIMATSNFSPSARNNFIQKFDLGGRDLEIEMKGDALQSELVTKLMSNIKIQIDLKLFKGQLVGSVENARGAIKLTLDQPQKSDLLQIQKILRALG